MVQMNGKEREIKTDLKKNKNRLCSKTCGIDKIFESGKENPLRKRNIQGAPLILFQRKNMGGKRGSRKINSLERERSHPEEKSGKEASDPIPKRNYRVGKRETTDSITVRQLKPVLYPQRQEQQQLPPLQDLTGLSRRQKNNGFFFAFLLFASRSPSLAATGGGVAFPGMLPPPGSRRTPSNYLRQGYRCS